MQRKAPYEAVHCNTHQEHGFRLSSCTSPQPVSTAFPTPGTFLPLLLFLWHFLPLNLSPRTPSLAPCPLHHPKVNFSFLAQVWACFHLARPSAVPPPPLCELVPSPLQQHRPSHLEWMRWLQWGSSHLFSMDRHVPQRFPVKQLACLGISGLGSLEKAKVRQLPPGEGQQQLTWRVFTAASQSSIWYLCFTYLKVCSNRKTRLNYPDTCLQSQPTSQTESNQWPSRND